jgi:hypothetical protein
MVKSFLLGKAAQGVLACTLAGSVFWWVAGHSGPRESTVVVHVLEPGVEVTLAGQLYHFPEPTSEPLVLHLPAGSHHFLVRRGETILLAQSFTLRGGESRVLSGRRHEDRTAPVKTAVCSERSDGSRVGCVGKTHH